MAIIEKGQFFKDNKAVKLDTEPKSKYFITLTQGNEEDDPLLCFVLNTEDRMDLYKVGCNKKKEKFILSPDIQNFTFLKNFSAIMLLGAQTYKVFELFENDGIEVLEKDIADDELLRQIKNCIDINNLLPKEKELLDENYKKKKKV